MARKPTPAPKSKAPPMDEDEIQTTMVEANALALALRQQDERVTKLATKLKYGGSTDPEALENSARDAIRRMGMAVFELGAYLLLLKEGCPHGQFLPVLERLKLAPRAAQQYMSVTRRFANTTTSSHLEAAGLHKLVELLPLDDEQIDALSELGQTGELALDDVATMSVKELRAAVRKERAVKGRLESVNKELNEELALKSNLKMAATDWPARFKGLMDQADLSQRTLELHIGALDAISQAAIHIEPASPEEEASLTRAREALAERMLAIHRRCAAYLEATSHNFSKMLGAFASEGL